MGNKIAVSKAQTSAQKKAAAKAEAAALTRASAVRLAQVVNLHLAGMSLAEIGASIGATAEEVDRMLQTDAQRYIRSQPALRTYVRNWVSGKYATLLEAVWADATAPTEDAKITANGFDRKLASQDRAIKILDRMAKLHGADAPVQTEIKVEAAPEAVDKLVQALAASQGRGYDVNIFDVVEAEVVHEAVEQAGVALEVSGNHVEDGDEDFD